MRSLDDIYRNRLLKAAVFLCAIGLLLAPLAGRSSMPLQAHRITGRQLLDPQTPAQKSSSQSVAIDRDPFAVPPGDVEKPAAAQSGAAGVVGMTVHQGDAMGYAVPGRSTELSGSIVVRAIVSGSNPSALVEESGKPRVVQIGDALGGVAISGIDRDGVLLQDGRRFAIEMSDR